MIWLIRQIGLKRSNMILRDRTRIVMFGVFTMVLSVIGMFLSNNQAYARPSIVNIQESIRNKVIYQGVYKCYTANAMAPSLIVSNYQDINSIVNPIRNTANSNGNYVPLVSGSGGSNIFNFNGSIGYNVADDGLSCRELIVGHGADAPSILEVSGKREPVANDMSSRKEFLNGMGYVESSNGSNESDLKCYSAIVQNGNNSYLSNIICQDNEQKLGFGGQSAGGAEFYGVGAADFNGGGDNTLCLRLSAPSQTGMVTSEAGCAPLDGEISPQSIHAAIELICGGNDCEFNQNGVNAKISFSPNDSGYVEQPVGGDSDRMALKSPVSDAGMQAVRYLSGIDYTADSLKINRMEKRILYQEYLTSYYGVEMNCDEGALSENLGTVRWFDSADGVMKDCQITNGGNGNKNKSVNGVNSLGNLGYHDIANLDELLAALNSDDMKDYTEEELAEMGAVANGSRVDQGPTDDCRGMGAGRSLGWILCPILELMGDGAEGIYQSMVVPMLEIKSYLFNGQDTAVYRAWSTFRDIANVMFVIVLLVVIFSQVTGIGIDNYGIKRILPKLIVCIVLINMSYLICAILIDLSNILGNGLRLMFENLGSELGVDTIMINQPAQAYPSGASAGSGFNATAIEGMVGVGLLVGFATMAGPIWAVGIGPMVLISLLFGALGVLISIVFTFFLLGARQSAIVVLVAISPVIVLFSALPNTKSVYSRFVKMFQILLFVYPIMGLLMGGGNYVSKLLLLAAPGEFYMALTAMVVGIVPIFFLPSLLKEAITALPKVGQMFSGLGDKARNLSGMAKGATLKSEPVKNLERSHQLSAAGKTLDRLGKVKGDLSASQKRQLLAAASTKKKLENENEAADIFVATEKYRGRSINSLQKDLDDALTSGNSAKAKVLLGAMTELHGAKSTAGYLGSFYADKGRNLDTEGLRTSIGAVKEHVTSNPGIMKELKEDNKDILSMLVSGGQETDGSYYGLGHYTEKEARKNKMEHWVTQSNEALQRAAASGVLGSEKAQSILDANNEKSSVFYNKLSDENREYLGKIAGSGSGTGSSGAGGAASSASGPVEPVGTIESNYGGSSLNSSQSDEWRRQYAAEEQMQNTIDNARRNGGFGSSSNPHRNPPSNPPR